MFLFKRVVCVPLLVFIGAVLSTGCVSKSRAEIFKSEVKAPSNGAKLEPGAWDKFAEQDAKRNLGSTRTAFWFLPFDLYVKDFHVAKDRESARSKNFSWNDLSTPILFTTLPLRFAYSEYRYEKGREEPVSENGFHWTLFWAQSRSKGKPTSLRLKAHGVPLFFGDVGFEDRDRDIDVSFTHILWTLGPAWLRVHADNDTQKQKGYFAAPFLLGGICGTVLWSDYQVRTDEKNLALGHGPLFGFAGYWKQEMPYYEFETKEDPEKGKEEVRFIAGSQSVSGAVLGILWSQYTRRDLDGKIEKSRNGPLWSAFGWSHRDGKFAVRFLWIPIRF